MLKESYLSNIKNLPEGAVKIIVTRNEGHILSPSWKLLNDYRSGLIDWGKYIERFKQEMNNDVCVAAMRKIKWEAKFKDIFLICYEKKYPCHRFLLIDMINKLDEDNKKEDKKEV